MRLSCPSKCITNLKKLEFGGLSSQPSGAVAEDWSWCLGLEGWRWHVRARWPAMPSASCGNHWRLRFRRQQPVPQPHSVCVCVLAGVIFNWLRSAGVRNSYTLQPCGGPLVKSWTLHAEGCRTGPQPTLMSAHVSLTAVSPGLYRSAFAPWTFLPFVFIRATTLVCFFLTLSCFWLITEEFHAAFLDSVGGGSSFITWWMPLSTN